MRDLGNDVQIDDKTDWKSALQIEECFVIPLGDPTTALTTGTNKAYFRMPFALTVTKVKATLFVVSSSGTPTFDINEGGTTIMSTNKLTVDASEKTSDTAATAAGVTDANLANDAEITIDCDVAGTGAQGAIVYIYGYRP